MWSKRGNVIGKGASKQKTRQFQRRAKITTTSTNKQTSKSQKKKTTPTSPNNVSVETTQEERGKKKRMKTHLFVEFNPCEVTFRICILQSKEPDLAKSDRFDDLVEQLLAGGALLDCELQLGVHCRNTNI